ncbi:recombinase zinc beta ribbon domain-containing protein, partial [Nocardioides aquiterrae]
QEVGTVTGRPWVTTTLRGMLTNPRYAGLRTHRGTIVGPAVWEPIITEDEHRRILAKYAEKKNSGRRTPQRYLLSGMVRCGKCGNRLYSSLRQRKSGSTRRYVCSSGPDHGGCGKLTVTADPLERFIADAVLYRLDTPGLADTLAGRSSADARTRELTRAVDEAQEQLEELSLAYANRHITMREWMTAKAPITQRLENTQRQLAAISHTTALTGLIGNGDELRRSWASLNLSRQNAIVGALVDHITIGPGTPGARELDPSRVDVVWRH